MAATGQVGWTTEEDAREGGAPEGEEEAGVSVTASPPSACKDIGGHHMPPSPDLAHRWARRLSREGGAMAIRWATRCGVLAEVDGCERWGLGHGATALDNPSRQVIIHRKICTYLNRHQTKEWKGWMQVLTRTCM
jgi:hypothetical protein